MKSVKLVMLSFAVYCINNSVLTTADHKTTTSYKNLDQDDLNSFFNVVADGFGWDKIESAPGRHDVSFNTHSINGSRWLKEQAKNMGTKIDSRRNLARGISLRVEEDLRDYKDHDRNRALVLECCRLRFQPHDFNTEFNLYVDTTTFCLQPGHDTALSTHHYLSPKLIEQFIYNREEVEDLKWQYFTSIDSVSYIYPSFNVGPSSPCIKNQDLRRRPWYYQAMSPFARDVLIIIDMSKDIEHCILPADDCYFVEKKMLKLLLEPLSPQDRFGVYIANGSTLNNLQEGYRDCEDELEYATEENKRDVNELFASVILPLTLPLDLCDVLSESINIFKRQSKKIDRNRREQLIVFITDGFELSSDEMLYANLTMNQAHDDLPNLQILTYHLDVPTEDVESFFEELRNSTKKSRPMLHFQVLRNLKEIYSIVPVYYHVYARPNYKDPSISTPYPDAGGIGLVTTIMAPVFLNGYLVGVACVDIPVKEFLTISLFDLQTRSDSYIFAFERNFNTTLMHPRLPLARSDVSRSVAISDLETSDGFHRKLYKMMLDPTNEGSVMFETNILLPKGHVHLEGVSRKKINATYFYGPVDKTDFSMALVIPENDGTTDFSDALIVSEILESTSNDHYIYHQSELQSIKLDYCTHFFRKSLANLTTFLFSYTAFKNQEEYLHSKEKKGDVDKYLQIIQRKRPNYIFHEGIPELVSFAHLLVEHWRDFSHPATYAIWRYVALKRGVMVLFPGISKPKATNPSLELWYLRAVSDPQNYQFSHPYLDVYGGGHAVRISRAIFEGDSTRILGVVGMEVPVQYIYQQLLKIIPVCADDTHVCILMDNSGFVVLHKNWVKVNLTTTPNIRHVHISNLESDIAWELVDKNVTVQKACVDLHTSRKQWYFEVNRSQLNADLKFDYFKIVPISLSNLNLIVIDERLRRHSASAGRCNCSDPGAQDTPICIEDKDVACQCPCFTHYRICSSHSHVFDHGITRGTYTEETVCPPMPIPIDRHSLMKEKKDIEKLGMAPCYNHYCRSHETVDECHMFAKCRYCSVDYATKEPLDEPYCGDYDECFYGQVGHPSPYAPKTSGSLTREQFILIFMTILCIVLMALFAALIYFKLHYKPGKKHKSKSLGFGRPRGSSINNESRRPSVGESESIYHEGKRLSVSKSERKGSIISNR